MSELNWDRDPSEQDKNKENVLDRKTASVAYVGGNPFFRVDKDDFNQYHSIIIKDHILTDPEVNGVYEDLFRAEKICEHLHELAEINHGYKN